MCLKITATSPKDQNHKRFYIVTCTCTFINQICWLWRHLVRFLVFIGDKSTLFFVTERVSLDAKFYTWTNDDKSFWDGIVTSLDHNELIQLSDQRLPVVSLLGNSLSTITCFVDFAIYINGLGQYCGNSSAMHWSYHSLALSHGYVRVVYILSDVFCS